MNNNRSFEDLQKEKSIVRSCKTSEKVRQIDDIFNVFLDAIRVDLLCIDVYSYYAIV